MVILKKLFLAMFFGGICICAYAASENAAMDSDSSFLIIPDANRANAGSELSLFAADEGVAEDGSVHIETQALRSGLREAGYHLGNYRAMCYGGILWSAGSQILSIGKSPANSLAIGLPGTLLSMLADYGVGKAGERLQAASESGPTGDLYPLGEAGRNLKKYRTAMYIGYAAAYAGDALILMGIADDDPLVLTGALLVSFMAPLIASTYVGTAGRNIQAAADSFPQYQYGLKEAGRNFETYRDRMHSAFVYFGLGLGTFAVGQLVPDMTTSMDIATLASISIGIIRFLSAPWCIGTAGENMEMAGR